MNNIFKNQDIRGIILSKKKKLIDEEVLLELLLNETQFRHKIMLAELKNTIEEIMCYEFGDKYEEIDCPPAPIDEDDCKLFLELIICPLHYLRKRNYPYFDPDKFKLDYDGNLFDYDLFQTIYGD
jgi:hypothetical protein